jgi:hypothetical protein
MPEHALALPGVLSYFYMPIRIYSFSPELT